MNNEERADAGIFTDPDVAQWRRVGAAAVVALVALPLIFRFLPAQASMAQVFGAGMAVASATYVIYAGVGAPGWWRRLAFAVAVASTNGALVWWLCRAMAGR